MFFSVKATPAKLWVLFHNKRPQNTDVGVVFKATPTKSATVVGVSKSYGCYIAKLWVYVRLKYLSYYMNVMLV